MQNYAKGLESTLEVDYRAALKSGECYYYRPSGRPVFTKVALKRQKGLYKYESSLPVQARTGAIVRRAFLFRRRVPRVALPSVAAGKHRKLRSIWWCASRLWRALGSNSKLLYGRKRWVPAQLSWHTHRAEPQQTNQLITGSHRPVRQVQTGPAD